MSDDELRLTRRYFLRQTALTAALSGGMYCVSQKTDALAADIDAASLRGRDANQGGMFYQYHDPP
jgi:hypothetical protein